MLPFVPVEEEEEAVWSLAVEEEVLVADAVVLAVEGEWSFPVDDEYAEAEDDELLNATVPVDDDDTR
jgi:hypothetical protein